METDLVPPSVDEGSPSLDLAAERAEPSAGRQRALTPKLSKPVDKLRRTGYDTQSVTFLSERMVKGCAQGATDHCIGCVECNNWTDGAKFELPRKMPTADHPFRIVFAIEGIGWEGKAGGKGVRGWRSAISVVDKSKSRRAPRTSPSQRRRPPFKCNQ